MRLPTNGPGAAAGGEPLLPTNDYRLLDSPTFLNPLDWRVHEERRPEFDRHLPLVEQQRKSAIMVA